MKMVKSLLLGSAATLVVLTGAQAADLPVKAKAVEYVKICSLYGAGFYYIPGTDTCIRFSGFLRYEVSYNSYITGTQDVSSTTGGAIATLNYGKDYYAQRTRAAWQTDARTQTEWGTLRSYTYLYLTSAGGGGGGGGSNTQVTAPTLLQGYIQLAGFTVGKFKSAFYAPWSSNMGTYNSGIPTPDDAGSSTGAMYTYQFGNGVSASIGAFDPRRGGMINTTTSTLTINPTTTMFANSYIAGDHAPDIAANIQVDQAWGFLHLGAVAHELAGTYYGATEPTGHPNSTWGYAVNGSLNLKNLPTGAGDQIWLSVAYSDGASGLQGNNTPFNSIALFSGGSGGFYNNLGWTYITDGVYSTGGAINKTRMITSQAAFEHFWIPTKLKTSIYGYAGKIEYNAAANALLCGKFVAYGAGTTLGCNFDTRYWAVGSRTTWFPVRDLEVALDVTYTEFNFGHTGFITVPAANPILPTIKPGGTYNIKDQGVVTGALRVVRSW